MRLEIEICECEKPILVIYEADPTGKIRKEILCHTQFVETEKNVIFEKHICSIVKTGRKNDKSSFNG